MNKLTNEEVLHVAELARLKLSDEEIEKFSYQLKSLMDEINKITDVEIDTDTDEVLIAPFRLDCALRDDEFVNSSNAKEIINNAPVKFDNFIEVAGVFDE